MPLSGVAKSGRVWRKVPESDARSVHLAKSLPRLFFVKLKSPVKLCEVLVMTPKLTVDWLVILL